MVVEENFMPKIAYIEKRFIGKSLALINKINSVITDYEAQGYKLTLRQVYYQMVARNIIENNLKSYNNLGNLINDARLMGLIDWNSIEDRTRNLQCNLHFENPQERLDMSARNYMRDHWEGQSNYCEVWVEKDALIGVVGRICQQLDVPYFSCRGYTSQSEMWVASQRLIDRQEYGQYVSIFHLGDHDPSGKDMSRDIVDRLMRFEVSDSFFEFKRLALNYDQVEAYKPPPNPAKMTDTRFENYVAEFGEECWELDALEPKIISNLIANNVLPLRNETVYESVLKKEAHEIKRLQALAQHYGSLDKNWKKVIETIEPKKKKQEKKHGKA